MTTYINVMMEMYNVHLIDSKPHAQGLEGLGRTQGLGSWGDWDSAPELESSGDWDAAPGLGSWGNRDSAPELGS
jgi:hypothetical protein